MAKPIDKPVETAEEAMDLLRRSNPCWLGEHRWGISWIFRGHGHSGPGILPKAWREKQEDHFLDQHAYYRQQVVDALRGRRLDLSDETIANRYPEERILELIVQRNFEFSAVHDFAMIVDELGFKLPGGKVPNDWPPLDDVDLQKAELKDDSIFQLRALAQHHRVPTRLLDWTENPFVALYWATESANAKEDAHIAVWALNTTDLPKSVRLLSSERSAFDYLRAQDGMFTYIEHADHDFLETGEWPKLDDRIPDGE
jgi:hypothetical protein